MNLLKNWLLGIVAAAVAVALAQSLTPEGAVKKVGRLVGGLVLLIAVVRPVIRLEIKEPSVTAGAYGSRAAEEAGQGGEEVMKSLIAEKTGAYIVDKGRALGCCCEVEITVKQDEAGWPVPWAAEVSGTWTGEQRQELARVMEEELDIPAERQTFREGVA